MKVINHMRAEQISQIRAARALVDWTQQALAEAAGLSALTVKRFETHKGAKVSDDAIARMRQALESAGVLFIPPNGDGGGLGVRLKKIVTN